MLIFTGVNCNLKNEMIFISFVLISAKFDVLQEAIL